MSLTTETKRGGSAALLVIAAIVACINFNLFEESEQLGFIGEKMFMLHENNRLIFEVSDGVDGGDYEVSDNPSELAGRRALLDGIDLEDNGQGNHYDAAFSAVYNSEPKGKAPLPQIPPYNLIDAVNEAAMFQSTFADLVYNPEEDTFVVHYSQKHRWVASNRKLFLTINHLVYLLRKVFPDRFAPDQPELAISIGSGDFPSVKLSKLPHNDGKAPILEFGSVFRDTSVYPNMIPMPMPESHHLKCYEQWVTDGSVCDKMKPATEGGSGKLIFGEELGMEFENLIPQLIWRGSDFDYLPALRPRSIKPFAFKLEEGEEETNTKVTAVHALRENYDRLRPRWKAVTMTAEAETQIETRSRGENWLPWADMKFARSNKMHEDTDQYYLEGDHVRMLRGSDNQDNDLITYQETGIPFGNHMSLLDLAKYKYHIDLGGGGGTTWAGTIQKLAMKGLLFHHVNPTIDYYHAKIEPWRHYIPVSSNLKDLKLKFDWAESHPEEAKWIIINLAHERGVSS